jgi:hypothetical protein
VVQGGGVDLLQDHGAAGADQAQVAGHLLLSVAQREDQAPGVDQVERGGLQLAGEQVIVDQRHIAETLGGRGLFGGGQHRRVDVGPDDLPVGADPVAEQPQPAERAAADVQGAGSLTVAELGEQASAGGFRHPRPELEALQLPGLTGQQVRIGAHGVSHHSSGAVDGIVGAADRSLIAARSTADGWLRSGCDRDRSP